MHCHTCDNDNSMLQIALVMLRCFRHTTPVLKLEKHCCTAGSEIDATGEKHNGTFQLLNKWVCMLTIRSTL